MRKTTLRQVAMKLAVVAVALLAPLGLRAQETVTIGDGTATDYYTPIGTYYNYSITEQLYTAEEIGMAGNISSISFYYAGTAAKDFPVTVYMMNTDAENLSTGISLADADVVFEGTYSVTGTGWMTIELDAPFAYDGTSNLLIGINKGNLQWYSGGTWYHTTTSAVMARYTQNDDNAYTTSTTPGTTRTARPNIQLTITPNSGAPTCARPTGVNVTTNGLNAEVTWNGDATRYYVAHSMDANANPDDAINGYVTTNSFSLSGLELGDHYVWVKAECEGIGESDWTAKKSFHIGYCVPAPSSVDGNGISNVTFGVGDHVVNNDSPKATYTDYSEQVGALQEGVESNIAITFKTSFTYNTYVWVDLNNNLSFEPDEVVCYGESTSSNPTTLTLSFVIPTTQALGTYRMRIGSADSGLGDDPDEADPCYTGSYGCFQDYSLLVLEAPSCLTPTGVNSSNVSGHEATIAWTSDAGLWQIQLDDNEPINVDETPSYTFTGLAAETNFSVKVRSNCGGTYSEWSNPISFTTTVACPAPTVAISEITAHTAVVSCTNTAAERFNVMLGDDLVAEGEAMPYTLTGLTTDHSYTVKVQAVCGGEDGESSWSTGTTFTTAEECPDGVVCIGTGKTTNGYVPTYTYYNYSLTQQIYTAEEIGGEGAIMSIDFYSTASERTRNLDIYMVMTDKASFASTTDYITVTASDLVYSGNVTFAQNDWTTIQLNTPFAYADATKNVALIVHDKTGGYESSPNFRVFDAPNMSLYAYNDYNTYDPSNPGTYDVVTNSTTTYTFSMLSKKNRIRLVMGEIVDCDMPTDLTVSDITMETANLTWTAGASETAWQVCINGDEDHLIDVTNNAYQMTGLTAATIYTAKVRANCGSGQSYWTPEISFNTALCNAANQCEISYEFAVSGSSTTWHSASIDVVDVETSIVLANLTYDAAAPTGTVAVCDGREIEFVYNTALPSAYNSYNSYTFTDVNDEEILSGTGAISAPATYIVSCVVTNCRAPQNLAASEIAGHSVKLSWTEMGEADRWVVAYKASGASVFTEVDADANPFTLTGLVPETEYSIKVRPACEDNVEKWSGEITCTTDVACPVPTVVVEAGSQSATVTINGEADVYNLRYRVKTADGIQDFENGMAGWTTIDADDDGYTWVLGSEAGSVYLVEGGSLYGGDHSGAGDLVCSGSYSNVEGVGALTPDNYLVSPQITLGGTISFYAAAQDNGYPAEHFGVAVSTTGNTDAADFTTIEEWTMDANGGDGSKAQGAWGHFTVDLSDYSGQGYVAIRHFDCTDQFILLIDDIEITEPGAIEIPWTTLENQSSPVELTGLDPETTYEVEVQAVCGEDGESQWVSQVFTTLPVSIDIEANKWYAISTPVTNNTDEYESLDGVINLIPAADEFAYDLYGYTESAGTWDAPTTATGLVPGKGYIYRRTDDAKLYFSGNENSGPVDVALTYACTDADLKGFNLIGNPYPNTYSYNSKYYSLNTNGTWTAHENGTIGVAEGFLVHVSAGTTMNFTEGGKKGSASSESIVFTVSNEEYSDVAYAKLESGDGLPKIGHLNSEAPMLSIPMEGRRYAIANLGSNCESFDMVFRGSYGEYSLSVANGISGVSYLHLIDRVAGKDIDLLRQPVYTFSATGNDADRFMVKLSASALEDAIGNFAYWNGSEWVVEGNGTLQVFDVLGRQISVREVNSQISILNSQFPSTGVYVLRLGEKSQKIVVK